MKHGTTENISKMESIREITERIVNINLGGEAVIVVFSRLEDGEDIIDIFSNGIHENDRILLLEKAIGELA